MTRLPDFPIPEEVTPADRVCVQFTIPNNVAYRQIVLGWMNQLCYSFNWQKDGTHNAVTCSNLFKQSRAEMIASLTEGCTGNDMYFRMRISPTDGCTSEAQYEPNGEWIPFMSQCCCDQNTPKEYRISPIDGTIEVSSDGGVTWEEDATSVYAMSVEPVPLAGVDGSVKRCEAANNVVDNLKDVQAGISAKLAQTYTLYDFAVAILVEIIAIVLAGLTGLALAPLVIALIPKIIETARAIFGLSQAAYDALFTEVGWTTVRCIAYCNVQNNGKFTAAGWAKTKSDLEAQLGSGATQAGANLAAMVDVWALTGLNHAAAIGAGTEGNCDDCPCGCDLSQWTVAIGTEISRDATSITIQSVVIDGSHVIALQGEGFCCTADSYTQSEQGSPVIQHNLCGETSGIFPAAMNHTGLFPTSLCIADIQIFGFQGADIGIVTINFSGDCV